MKITKVEPLLLDRFLYVRVHTDAGITGLGESGTWGQLEASAASIAKYGDYLVGRDPFPIEHHWNVMLRANHFTGGAITGAVSAIDIALWDIKGKYFNVPVYELLGGKMRHKARLYGHVKGRTIEKLVEEAVRLKEAGFTALGHLNPLLDEDETTPYYKSHADKIETAIDNVRRLREAVGPKVDLCIEIHRRLTPPEAIALGRGIEKYTPMFYEDPLRPNSFDAMADVARHIDIPIATGERFTSLYQFQTLYRPATPCSTCGPMCASAAASPGPRRSPRWPKRTMPGWCRIIRSRRLAPPRACRSPPASRTSRSRNIPRAHPIWTAGRSCWAMAWRPAWRSRRAVSLQSPPHRASGWNWWRMRKSASPIARARSQCGPM